MSTPAMATMLPEREDEPTRDQKARLRAEATAILLNRHRDELRQIYKELCEKQSL